MARRDTQASTKQQLEKMQRRLRWLFRYDARTQDSMCVQQRIYFGKRTLEFLDKFPQGETLRPQTVFKMLQRLQQLKQPGKEKFCNQLSDFLVQLLKLHSGSEFNEQEFDFFNKKIEE